MIKTEISIEQIRPELTWHLRQKVLYPTQKLNEMKMDEDNYGLHFAAFKDNYIVGVISLFQKENDYQFRKFAVDEAVQGIGIGTAMLNYITNFTITNGGKRLWCNARLSAITFYLNAGFKQAGILFTKNGFDYEILEKEIIVLDQP